MSALLTLPKSELQGSERFKKGGKIDLNVSKPYLFTIPKASQSLSFESAPGEVLLEEDPTIGQSQSPRLQAVPRTCSLVSN